MVIKEEKFKLLPEEKILMELNPLQNESSKRIFFSLLKYILVILLGLTDFGIPSTIRKYLDLRYYIL